MTDLKTMKRSLLAAWAVAISVNNAWGQVGDQPEVSAAELVAIPSSDVSSALAAMEVAEGFEVEAVAAEPLVMDPVAMAFDEAGRLYVVEMRDYSERRPESLGRIRRLEDRDGDGVMDHSEVFVDGLPWPTAVICYMGGIFVGATPDILYFKDEDGDGKADLRETVFTGFASAYTPFSPDKLNVQALLNSFRWGLDNRIHGSASASGGMVKSLRRPEDPEVNLRGRDFSFDPETGELRPETGGAQHGMSFDDFGRKYVSSNSDHIQQVVVPYRYLGMNPHLPSWSSRVSIAADGPAAPVYRLSPDEAWRVIRTKWRVAGQVRGPVEGGGRPSGYFTGATGVTIYRGDQWPLEHRGNALIADVGSNLVHRKVVDATGIISVARRYESDAESELIASRQNWFRPVQFANAPDGTMWVADMSREIIEHPWSLPENIKQYLDLNHGNTTGRIFRIRAKGREVITARNLADLSSLQLVETLGHANGWHRDTASRLLVERNDSSVRSALKSVVEQAPEAVARIHALYILRSLGWLDESDVRSGLVDSEAVVRIHGLRLAETLPHSKVARLRSEISALLEDEDPNVVFQLALSLGNLRYADRVGDLTRLMLRDDLEQTVRLAVLNSAGTAMLPFWNRVLGQLEEWTSPTRIERLLAICEAVGPALTQAQRFNVLARLAKERGLNSGILIRAALRAFPGKIQVSASGLPEVIRELETYAGTVIRDESRPVNDIVESFDLLRRVESDSFFELVKIAVKRDRSSTLVGHCLRLCRGLEIEGLGDWMNSLVARLLPEARRDLLNLAFEQTNGARMVVNWLENGSISLWELTERQRDDLLRDSNSSIRLRAETVLKNQGDSSRDLLEKFVPALLMESDLKEGRRLFFERCALCHQLGEAGVAVGPAVTSMRGLRKRGILEAILSPSREVAPQYLAVTVATDSEVATGVISAETDQSIVVRQAGGIEQRISKADVTSVRSEGMSLMPTGLLGDLTSEQVASLLEFIMYGEN